MGSTHEQLTDTLYSAYWAYSQTLTLILDHFDFDVREEFTRDYGAAVERELPGWPPNVS